MKETVYTGQLYAITEDNQRIDMRMNLQDHDIFSLLNQAEECAKTLGTPKYKKFEMDLGVKDIIVSEE